MKEKQLIALINSGADMYRVHRSFEGKKATEKRNHTYTYRLPTHSDTHTHTYIQTQDKGTERTNERITVWKINSFYRKIEEKQWNTISNDKWHKILQVTATERKRSKAKRTAER